VTSTFQAPAPRPLKRAIVGRPMATGELEETLLPKTLALPIFASDPLSSVAYATESALVVLIAASATAAHLVFPLSLAIAALLAIVVISYRQTVRAYETSGGAYVVAKDNLGTLPSLVGAAALLTDYVLTVAVSIAAGIFAVTSIAPSLAPHKVLLSLVCLGVIVFVNLRGVRESGLAFALPTYAFVAAMFTLVVVGLAKTIFGETPHAVVPDPVAAGAGGVTLFVLLRAFSSGSTALTGVEAIANGVNAFRKPHGKNAATTLAILGGIAITLFLGVSYLAVQEHARPSETASVVSQIARATFPGGSAAGFMYYGVQATTLLILVLAANTSFQGFPRLAALLARDGFAPRQFTNLGDRLVFSNGMLVLATLAGLLIWVYGANVNSLIHLYVIGVFTAFTLSQAGMVRYWKRVREPGWHYRAIVNGVGASATGLVAAIVIVTKFAAGAWIVTIAIPALVLLCYATRRHYRGIERRLRAGTDAVVAAPPPTNTTLLVVESIDEAAADALWFARTTSDGGFRAIHVPSRRTDSGIKPRWFRFSDEHSHLEVLDGSLGGNRGRAGAGLAAAARRVELRHRGHSRAVPPRVAPRRNQAAARVAAEAAAALRAGRRRRERAGPCGVQRRSSGAGGRPRAPFGRQRGLDAGGQLRARTGGKGHARSQFRLQRRRRRRDSARVECPGFADPARDRRGAVSRYRDPIALVSPRADRRWQDGGGRGHARAGRPRRQPRAPQQACPLHQASASVRATGHPGVGSLPVAALTRGRSTT
jgi:amino acid transporter